MIHVHVQAIALTLFYTNPILYSPSLQAVYERDPEYAIRRFESGRYAVNDDVRTVYQKAVAMTMVREMEWGKCIHSLLLSSLILITTEV